MPFVSMVALAAVVFVLYISFQGLSAALLLARLRLRVTDVVGGPEPVSLIVPIVGLSAFEVRSAACVLDLSPPAAEILFCAFDRSDPAVAQIAADIARRPGCPARILIGRAHRSPNPKMDNVEKGFAAARHDMVVCVDGNVALHPAILTRLQDCWTDGTGLVSAPPLGTDPHTFWAEVECAVLNTQFARSLLVADSLGHGFAHGKLLMMRRSLLDRLGGVGALARETAEDAAATKIVRAAGLRIRLLPEPVAQPLGVRRAIDVWDRNLRWARLRRRAFPWLYACEPLLGTPAFLLAAHQLGRAMDWTPGLALLGAAVAAYGFETGLTRATGWHLSRRMPGAFMVRDAMMLAIWAAGWFGNGYAWRGNTIELS